MYYCVVPENIHTPMKGTFTLEPPPEFPLYTVGGACPSPTIPWNFHYALYGVLVIAPHPLEFV